MWSAFFSFGSGLSWTFADNIILSAAALQIMRPHKSDAVRTCLSLAWNQLSDSSSCGPHNFDRGRIRDFRYHTILVRSALLSFAQVVSSLNLNHRGPRNFNCGRRITFAAAHFWCGPRSSFSPKSHSLNLPLADRIIMIAVASWFLRPHNICVVRTPDLFARAWFLFNFWLLCELILIPLAHFEQFLQTSIFH